MEQSEQPNIPPANAAVANAKGVRKRKEPSANVNGVWKEKFNKRAYPYCGCSESSALDPKTIVSSPNNIRRLVQK